MIETGPQGRLNYSGNLEPVIQRLGKAYGVGQPSGFSIINVGLEDCNVRVDTPKGKFVAKIFSKGRSSEDITRCSTIMEKAIEAGVNHPALMRIADGGLVYADPEANGLSMVLMKFIEGDTFMDLDRVPSPQERVEILEQAANINRIDYHPQYLFDSWAIPNIKVMFDKVNQFVKPEDLRLVEQVMAKYAQIPINNLPHCFVHGDLIKTNIIKGDDGKIYVLDFSVSNWYPRIQELAVITANLLHEADNPISLQERCQLVVGEYSQFNPLTPAEEQHLYPYALAGVAIEFIGAHQEKYINGIDTEEIDYWLSLGREGLRRELS